MLDTSNLIYFGLASLSLLLIPGPAVLYIIGRSLEQGRTAGIVSSFGVNLGSIVQILLFAGGLSALVVKSVLAFNVLKYAGAAYLIYLGIRTLLSAPAEAEITKIAPDSLGRIFRQGFIVNLLNPKVALFFGAFLPQFIDPARGSVALQTILLGLLFTGIAIITDTAYATLASGAGALLARNPRMPRYQKLFSGILYIALGVTTAMSGSYSKS